jgi:hypothetical protein
LPQNYRLASNELRESFNTPGNQQKDSLRRVLALKAQVNAVIRPLKQGEPVLSHVLTFASQN